MKTSFAVCILAALLAVGSCLQCEVCTAQGNRCKGPMITCAPGQDTCGILLMELMLEGEKTQTIVKTCAKSSECKTIIRGCDTSISCNAGFVSVSFGKGLAISMSSACCVGEACRTTPVTVPPTDTKPNDRSCPGCFTSPSEQCRDEIVDCTGAETHCIDTAIP